MTEGVDDRDSENKALHHDEETAVVVAGIFSLTEAVSSIDEESSKMGACFDG